MGSTFGKLFQITTWGESHGPAIGVVVDGCPAGLDLSAQDLQAELKRRSPGKTDFETPRREKDQAEILSGVFEGKTIGTPISVVVFNKDVRSKDYQAIKDLFRPSHGDFTYQAKYGHRDWRGGGRSSARETIGRVIGGAIAKKILKQKCRTQVLGYVKQVYGVVAGVNPSRVRLQEIEKSPVRCPDKEASREMERIIKEVKSEKDSIGGIVECVARKVPVGLGEPVFDKLEADLAKAMLSIPASKGFEVGMGFGSAVMRGSEHNDPFIMKGKHVHTLTNRSGGIQGGISNGEDIIIRVAFKPTATIGVEQDTVDIKGRKKKLKAAGRHDPCVAIRAVPIVEAMMSLVLADHFLLNKLATI